MLYLSLVIVATINQNVIVWPHDGSANSGKVFLRSQMVRVYDYTQDESPKQQSNANPLYPGNYSNPQVILYPYGNSRSNGRSGQANGHSNGYIYHPRINHSPISNGGRRR